MLVCRPRRVPGGLWLEVQPFGRARLPDSSDAAVEALLCGEAKRLRVNVGSGLTWSRSSTLCDLSKARGACSVVSAPSGPVPPAGMTLTPQAVGGTYRPLPLDHNGDGIEDIFWYAPGPAHDHRI